MINGIQQSVPPAPPPTPNPTPPQSPKLPPREQPIVSKNSGRIIAGVLLALLIPAKVFAAPSYEQLVEYRNAIYANRGNDIAKCKQYVRAYNRAAGAMSDEQRSASETETLPAHINESECESG